MSETRVRRRWNDLRFWIGSGVWLESRWESKRGLDWLWTAFFKRDIRISSPTNSAISSTIGHTTASFYFIKSRWFTRGWTLQELLAPREVVFLNKDWVEIGTGKSLARTISEITRIATGALEHPLCGSETCPHICRGYSVAQKMSWAALRKTTREEDRAYSVMGLFGVNMPLLYGEGGDKAFVRLQREIMKQSIDDSIFAWSTKRPPPHLLVRSLTYKDQQRCDFVAWRPELFYSGDEVFTAWSGDISATTVEGSGWTAATISHQLTAYGETQRYLSLTAPILTAANLSDVSEVRFFISSGEYRPKEPGVQYHQVTGTGVTSIFGLSQVIAMLSCRYSVGRVGIALRKHSDGTYSRFNSFPVLAVQVTKLPPRGNHQHSASARTWTRMLPWAIHLWSCHHRN